MAISSDLRTWRRRIDVAYACYGWIAIVLILSKILDVIYGDPETPERLATLQGIGMLVILPLAMTAIVAAVVGAKASLALWSLWRREAGLVLLPLLVLATLAAFFMVESETLTRHWLTLFAAGYAIAAAGLALRWFFVVRKRHS